ncbi:hypothetical protein GCM10023352_18920 [Rothia endophytica]|uniref:Uncharacterized protein n=1 Tax=Rothia endophytica TaxID=1324766 RepID=A0ABP9BUW6_9MICC
MVNFLRRLVVFTKFIRAPQIWAALCAHPRFCWVNEPSSIRPKAALLDRLRLPCRC